MPREYAVMRPMRTGTPKALLASVSRRGRNSPIRGTIQPCSTNQLRPKSSQAIVTSHSRKRMTKAIPRRRRDGKAGGLDDAEGMVGSINLRIMTASAVVRPV